MRAIFVIAIFAAAITTVSSQQPSSPAPARGQGRGQAPRGAEPLVVDDRTGFEPIFDGTTLKGWDGDPAFWRVENGALVGESTLQNAVKQNTFLIWRGGEPRNFELKVQFRINSTNSGIQIRSAHLPEGAQAGDTKIASKWVLKGYQADIDFGNLPWWDVVIIGAGPAGLAASLTTAHRGLTTLVIEAKELPGGQPQFLYADKKIDITDLLIQRMDNDFKAVTK